MKPISKILVPIDFTPQSTEAVHRAVELASDSNAEIVLLHFHEPDDDAIPTESIAYTQAQLERMTEPLKQRIEAARRDLEALGVRSISARLLFGEAAAGILGVASDEDFDLIVMGTHGRTGVSRWLLGSVAESVVRGAACPVLTVKAPAKVAAASASGTPDHSQGMMQP